MQANTNQWYVRWFIWTCRDAGDRTMVFSQHRREESIMDAS